MPAYLVDRGLPAEIGGWTLATIGLFNIVGAIIAGWLAGYHAQAIYPVVHLFRPRDGHPVYIMLPPSTVVTLVFGAVLGLFWLSTVPPTSGLVALMFGTRWLATLFGFAFFSHQVGGFLGVWLGGCSSRAPDPTMSVWWLVDFARPVVGSHQFADRRKAGRAIGAGLIIVRPSGGGQPASLAETAADGHRRRRGRRLGRRCNSSPPWLSGHGVKRAERTLRLPHKLRRERDRRAQKARRTPQNRWKNNVGLGRRRFRRVRPRSPTCSRGRATAGRWRLVDGPAAWICRSRSRHLSCAVLRRSALSR